MKLQSDIGPPGWFFESWNQVKEKHSRFKLSNFTISRIDDDVIDVREGFEDFESFQDVNVKQSQKIISSKAWKEMKNNQLSSELCKTMMQKLLMLTIINILTDSSMELVLFSHLNSK